MASRLDKRSADWDWYYRLTACILRLESLLVQVALPRASSFNGAFRALYIIIGHLGCVSDGQIGLIYCVPHDATKLVLEGVTDGGRLRFFMTPLLFELSGQSRLSTTNLQPPSALLYIYGATVCQYARINYRFCFRTFFPFDDPN